MARMTLHLIWDFDGTLYDAYPNMAVALVAALQTFGVKADADEAYRLIKRTLFHGVCTLAARYGLDTEALIDAFRAAHHAQGRMPLMPHAEACLAETAVLGCKHYLFTHRNRGAIAMLREDGLDRYFADFVTREDGFADKPSPEAILHLMRRHAFTGSEAYMVGDRDIDIQSGQAAGAQGILFDPEGFYPDLAAEHRVASLAEIVGIERRRLTGGV